MNVIATWLNIFFIQCIYYKAAQAHFSCKIFNEGKFVEFQIVEKKKSRYIVQNQDKNC